MLSPSASMFHKRCVRIDLIVFPSVVTRILTYLDPAGVESR